MLELLSLKRLHVGPVDLRLVAGECIALQGRSRSGKSVLLRMAADLDEHEGDCALDGRRCSQMPAPAWRREVTYVAPDSGWWAESIAEHFGSPAGLRTLLPRVGLAPEAVGWPVARLSTGERQRLALLRAIANRPRVFLLDEPTSGLDLDTRDQVEALLREQLRAGCAILLVTHDPGLAQRLAHRRFTMDGGRLQEDRP